MSLEYLLVRQPQDLDFMLANLTSRPDKADNQTLNNAKDLIAFTEDNNLYFIDKNNSKVAVTAESNSGIVSGQTYARSEFGISGGIFWSPKSNFLAFSYLKLTPTAILFVCGSSCINCIQLFAASNKVSSE
ncbi:MAG: hypothetical protein EOO92_25860 [Pedobacter sp.]|nr:MAG: hypothetical protein EOO92_25860 [Pedobacter sp.]